jgi:hypothetical protein
MLCFYWHYLFYAHHVYVYAIAFSQAFSCLKAFQSPSEKTKYSKFYILILYNAKNCSEIRWIKS